MPEAAILELQEDIRDEPVPAKRAKSSCMAKLDRLAWVTCNWYEIDGNRFAVRSTSERFGGWVRAVLRSYLIDASDDEDADVRYSVVVNEGSSNDDGLGRGLNILYLGVWDIVRTFDMLTLARSLLYDIEGLRYAERNDAVYLEASAVRGSGKTLLWPTILVPGLSKAGRRAQKAIDVTLPGTMWVGVDPSTGRLVPVHGALDVPTDHLQELARMFPTTRVDDRVLVGEELAVDRVLLVGAGPENGLSPIHRARALYRLADSVKNLRTLGGRALEGLASMVERADCYEIRFSSTQEMIDILGAALRHGAPDID